MRKNKEEIFREIDAHLQKSAKEYYSDFYIGITNDIERRLFSEHKVSKTNGWWIWCESLDKSVAQEIEEYYLDKGMKGDTGGGQDDSRYVYCYEITRYTEE